MKTRRIGAFSAPAMAAFALTLAAAGLVALFSGSAMFSPGDLSDTGGDGPLGGVASHYEIGNDCAACHVAPWGEGRMSDRCLECHERVEEELADPSSFHGALLASNPGLECSDCHPDHRGRDASLTEMSPISFPHETVGFSLAAHRTTSSGTAFACADCHAESIASLEPGVCGDCHREIDPARAGAHIDDYGDDCLACHDGLETYGADFDHDGTAFALTGAHAGVGCTACHLDARTIGDLRGADPACASCHLADDVHGGGLGDDCAACHTSGGWVPSTFDHDAAAFPLDGAHAEALCEDCHADRAYRGTPADCYSCHGQDDAHDGRFGADCGLCHTTTGWEPAVFDHASVTTACVSCHLADDAHDGRFGAECAACHSTGAWAPALFDHDLSEFPLTGAHAGAECARCHVDGFTGLSADCVSCHADPAFHLGAVGTDCASCHGTDAWAPARYGLSHPFITDEGGSGINHGRTSCRTCHPSTVFSYTCLSCHSDNQGGEIEEGEDDEDDD
ncbi:MAG: cytochrome c3 family protein [Actinobacteria bacterium]|nr:cytochrome c3 family protein [Actinomycetota bacterium]